MNNLQIFKNGNFGNVRVIVDENNNPWFCLKDVCDILSLGNPSQTKTRLDSQCLIDNEVLVNAGFGERLTKMTFINEDGLYDCVLDSKKPNAKQIRKWITSEVMPSIRKTGMYATEELLNNPDFLIQIATKLKEEKEARLALENKVQEDAPKVEFYDDVIDSNTTCDFKQASKVLAIPNLGRNKLFEILRKEGILQSNNEPYQEYINRGYFKIQECKRIDSNSKETVVYFKTVIFQKGLDYISKLLKKLGYKK